MRAIDTNVLVRVLVRDDAKQAKRADAFVGEGVWVSQLVLMETAWVLESTYGLSRERLARVVGMLLDHESIRLENPEVIANALAIFVDNQGVGFSDCLILATARAAGNTPLATFDRKLASIDGTHRL